MIMEHFKESDGISFCLFPINNFREKQRCEFFFFNGKKVPSGGGIYILCNARKIGKGYEWDWQSYEPDYISDFLRLFANAQSMPDKTTIYDKYNANSVLIFQRGEEGNRIIEWLKRTYYRDIDLEVGQEVKLINDTNIYIVIQINKSQKLVNLRRFNNNSIVSNIQFGELDI